MTFSDSDLIQSLKTGKLHIDCAHMELVQHKERDPKRWSGPGYIYQDAEGIISFKLYVNSFTNTSQVVEIDLSLKYGKPGMLYEESRYYKLIATSYDGDVWEVPRLFAAPRWYPGDRIYLTGRLYTISCERTPEEKMSEHYFQMRLFDDLDLPFINFVDTESVTMGQVRSLGAVRFDTQSGSFDIRRGDGELIIEVSSPSPFSTNFYMRVIETITFVSAVQALWRVVYTRDNEKAVLKLTSPRAQRAQPQLRRPIYTPMLTDRKVFWRLFAKYLDFSVSSAPEQGWHPCAVYIHNAIAASAGSLDAWAAGLCIAVEGLAGKIPVKKDAEEKERVQKIIACVGTFLKETSWLDETWRGRVLGLLRQLNQPRLSERLATLIKEGKVSRELVRTWAQLRPKTVHGTVIDSEAFDYVDYKEEFERWSYEIGCVTTLLYQITFAVIGYTESYTDYSKDGWPTVSVLPSPE